MDQGSEQEARIEEEIGSSPVGRGGAGTYIEGELGAYYLLQMLAGSDARGLPDARIDRVQFQGETDGYALDDLIVHGMSDKGSAILEIQSKRTATFAPKDPIFISICDQIVRSDPPRKPTNRHLMAAAVQRTSHAISGPYQDVLEWARRAESGAQFFARLGRRGVASPAMRTFAEAFRTHLVANGVADDDEATWAIIRRFLILEFDFESGAPQAKAHAMTLADQVLAPEDKGRAEALWTSLIELVIETGKAGGAITREALVDTLKVRGFRLAGDRNFALARAKLKEMSGHALKEIGTLVGRVNLPRLNALEAVEKARDVHRLIEISGKPGVGKSGVLRHLAERQGREGHVIVLDPIGTPDGGWSALAQRLNVLGTAKDFLGDLAASGGGVLFIDGAEMFTSAERRRTVNDLLHEIADMPDFSVVVSRRLDEAAEESDWLAADALAKLGPRHRVVVGELDDDEVAALSEAAPELRVLLAPGHPAASIARNLYRLTQLLKMPSAADIRTEVALADYWWNRADGAKLDEVRPAQRLLADLAEAALANQDLIEDKSYTPARAHLLRSLTLSELRRDRLGFYHDVLRDWAIGAHLHEDRSLLDGIDLSVPPSPRVARGIEFAGRFALEKREDGSDWQALLDALSRPAAHESWRRQALMAIVRSELSPELLYRCRADLLAKGGALLVELCTAIAATETMSAATAFAQAAAKGAEFPVAALGSLRIATTISAPTVLAWCIAHAAHIPIQAIGAIVKLVEIQFFTMMGLRELGQATARMLFGWLMQLDLRKTAITIPTAEDAPRLDGEARRTMIEDLRTMTLLIAVHAPEAAKAYLTAATAENDHYKTKAIRPLSTTLAGIAPVEIAALIEAQLIEKAPRGRSRRDAMSRAFGFADSDYMPASPAQPPFLDLLTADAEVGLGLIRKLVDAALAFRTDGRTDDTDGYTIVIDGKPRFFPWVRTYFWSRQMQAPESAVGSALMALEAWSHERLDRGDEVDAVLKDILGPKGSCAAYLVIAIDVLLSHWPTTRDALVPFIANPHLLAADRQRTSVETMIGGLLIGQKEPNGRARLADLAKRPSRGITLENAIPYYIADDETGRDLRTLLNEAVQDIGPYEEDASFGDPAFMGRYALNMLDQANWVEVQGGLGYRSPPVEAEHLERLEARRQAHLHSTEIEARIQLATNDASKGSPELARDAVEYAAGDLPDDSDTDHLKARSTRLIATAMLVARDGDDALLDEHESWVRSVIGRALEEEVDPYGSSERLGFNRPAQGLCALIHLWGRRGLAADRDQLLQAATRKDRAAVPAFAAALASINATDPRLLKAAVRIAFASCRWRWAPYDEAPEAQEAHAAERAREDAEAVAAEIAWLDGGAEPAWPALIEETPSFSRRPRAILSQDGKRIELERDEEPFQRRYDEASVHVSPQGLAHWLGLLNIDASAPPDWYGEIVDAYATWSARLNGHGYSAEAELDRTPDDWNHQFYILVAAALMDAAPDRCEALLRPIVELPDRPFCDVVDTVIYAADVRYFNERSRTADRACDLRRQLVTRTMALDRWSWDRRRGENRIDLETGPPIAKLLMNIYNGFGNTETYLVTGVFDRVNPLLETLRPMMPGGPTAFVALCTMNSLSVAPTARHLDFLLFAVESWLDATAGDPSMWHDLSIGRKVAKWFDIAAIEDRSLFDSDHPLRGRIDVLLSRLVSLGVGEAHEIEVQIGTRQKAR